MYQVINHEQHGGQVWSTHSRRDLAESAKRRYERRNPLALREPSLAFEIRKIEAK